MAELKHLDLGSILSSAETIKSQRQQNKLAELLMPLKVESATLANQGANQSREVDEMRFFYSAMGDADLSNPEAANASWNSAKRATAKAGGDVEGLSDQFDPNQYKVIQGVAALGGEASGNTFQFGDSKVIKDPSTGALSLATQRRNPRTGQVETVTSAVNGRLANPLGQTPDEKAILDAQTAGAKEDAKLTSQADKGAAASGAGEAGKQAIKLSGEAFEQLIGVRENIGQLDEVVRLLDDGAMTGEVASRLPSISEASKSLDNLQARMGLNVIQNTTFGALSEGELNLALNTALPKNKDPDALREWAIEKKAAQDKLARYLETTASYLGTPGNTIAGWLEAQRNQRRAARNPAPEPQPAPLPANTATQQPAPIKFMGFE